MKRPWLGLLAPLAFLPGFLAHQYPQPDFAGLVVLVSQNGGHGSGSYLGDGFVLTANHVIEGGMPVEVMDDRMQTYSAEIVSTDPINDVALIRIKTDAQIKTATMGCRAPRLGEEVSISGNPYSLQFATTYGRVAVIAHLDFAPLVMGIDGTILPGQSGGPVRDTRGYVIGIATATMTQPRVGSIVPIGYSVPSTRICPLLYKAGVI